MCTELRRMSCGIPGIDLEAGGFLVGGLGLGPSLTLANTTIPINPSIKQNPCYDEETDPCNNGRRQHTDEADNTDGDCQNEQYKSG